jgi:F0F1-type ATP synthase membrane subunit a
MKKVLKFLDDNYPALILIAFFACYEYLLVHGYISFILEISKNTIQRPYQIDSVSERINYCVVMSIIAIVTFHIPHFIIILIMKYLAKCSPPFNKKAFIILCISTVISMIIIFCLRLYGDFWLFRVI